MIGARRVGLRDSPEDVTQLGDHSGLFEGGSQLNVGSLDPLTVRHQQLGENGLHHSTSNYLLLERALTESEITNNIRK